MGIRKDLHEIKNTMSWLVDRATQENTITTNPVQRSVRRPAPIDYTEQLTANEDITRGLYRNTYPQLKLAGALAFAPIFVPVALMGVPVPTSDDDAVQETLTAIVDAMAPRFWMINRTCHRDGTCWVWPHYMRETGELAWEFIRDSTVTDIVRDVVTRRVIQIVTQEQMIIQTGEGTQRTVTRKRTFTPDIVRIEWGGNRGDLQDEEYRNPTGDLPVAFANEAEPNETRGVSDYGRILPDLKNYHDIDLAWSTELAKFKPKLLLGVQNVDRWLTDNGYTSVSDVDVPSADLLFYLKDKEEAPQLLDVQYTEAYAAKLKMAFHKIIEGSGIPEIAWGLKTEGNHASAEEQMSGLVQYVHAKQEQKNEPYHRLFSASMRLVSLAMMRRSGEFTVEWNQLDAVSDKTRSEVFRNFAQGVGYAMQWASLTKRQLHGVWKQNFPEATEEDFEEFVSGITDMAQFRQYSQATLTDAFDASGMMSGEDEEPSDQTEPVEAGNNGHVRWPV